MNRYKNNEQKLRVSCTFYFLLLPFNLLLVLIFCSFSPTEDCKLLISNAMKKINQLETETKDKGFYMEYTVTSDYVQEGKLKTANETFKIKLKADKSFVSGNTADIYKDSQTQVAIMKQQETIFISGSGDKGFSQQKMHNMMLLQDSTLKKSKVISCTNAVLADKKTYKQIDLIPGVDATRQMGLKKITFWIDEPKAEMKKMKFISTKEGLENKLELNINKTDYNYKGEIFEGTAISKALSPNGKLLVAYKNYRLVDARINKK